MADDTNVYIRFADPKGTPSSTVWRNALPPRAGDTTTIDHRGRQWAVKCGAALVTWENAEDGTLVQVFAVTYRPLKLVAEVREGC
jgi:hypothetical protein